MPIRVLKLLYIHSIQILLVMICIVIRHSVNIGRPLEIIIMHLMELIKRLLEVLLRLRRPRKLLLPGQLLVNLSPPVVLLLIPQHDVLLDPLQPRVMPAHLLKLVLRVISSGYLDVH